MTNQLIQEYLEDIKLIKCRIHFLSRFVVTYLHDREMMESLHEAYFHILKVEEKLRRVENG